MSSPQPPLPKIAVADVVDGLSHPSATGTSLINSLNAKNILKCVTNYIAIGGVQPQDLTIITFYPGQQALIQHMLCDVVVNRGGGLKDLQRLVKVKLVDEVQEKETDVVIVDVVEGFLQDRLPDLSLSSHRRRGSGRSDTTTTTSLTISPLLDDFVASTPCDPTKGILSDHVSNARIWTKILGCAKIVCQVFLQGPTVLKTIRSYDLDDRSRVIANTLLEARRRGDYCCIDERMNNFLVPVGSGGSEIGRQHCDIHREAYSLLLALWEE